MALAAMPGQRLLVMGGETHNGTDRSQVTFLASVCVCVCVCMCVCVCTHTRTHIRRRRMYVCLCRDVCGWQSDCLVDVWLCVCLR